MVLLKNEELKNISGGSLSGTFINAIIRGVSYVFELGRSLGSSLMRLSKNNMCN